MNREASRVHRHARGKYCCKVIGNQETAYHQCGIEEVSKGLTLTTERTIKGKVYESHMIPMDTLKMMQYYNELGC